MSEAELCLQPRWTRAVWTVVLCAAILSLYPLSAGPVAWALDRGDISGEMGEVLLTTVYAPLVWLLGHSPAYQQVHFWYINLWTGR